MLMRLLRPLPALAGAAIMFVTLDISAAERPDSFADQAEALSPACLLYTSPSPRDQRGSRMPSSA